MEVESKEREECEQCGEYDEVCVQGTQITDIPEVLLEYIFTYLPNYGRLLNCQLVCKTWKRCVDAAVERSKREFKNALRGGIIEWTDYKTNGGPSISGRYSHSCCVNGDVMYIFGGCTVANTTFNDLWTFELSGRQWVRPLVTGNYPPPKACASLVRHNDSLILFGGWTHSSPLHPLHQDWKLFNQIHRFDIKNNRWSPVIAKNECRSVAGHFSTVVNNEMIVFGGLVSDENMQNAFVPSNEIWVFNFDTLRWRNQNVNYVKPPPRYGHSQVVVDANHILIFGGCGGPNMLFSDVWLLTIQNNDSWNWKEIDIRQSDCSSSAPIIGFNPACKVDDLVVFLNKNQMMKPCESTKESPMMRKATERNQYSPQSVPHVSNSGNRLQPQPSKQERKLQLLGETSKPSIRPNSRLDRQRQLHNLNKMEQRLKELKSSAPITLPTIKQHLQRSKDFMSLCILDISKVLSDGFVQWLSHEKQSNGPQEKKLYTLIPTSSELIMFGGIQKNMDADSQTTDTVSNTVHIASFRRAVI